MKFSASSWIVAACVIAAPAHVFAAEQREDRPEIFRKLVDCRAVADNAQRLACYDAQVAALDSAEAKNEVVVVDKGQIREAKQTLFGLSLPTLSIFDSKDKEKAQVEQVTEIETTIKSAAPIKNTVDRWVIVLEDGARWIQTESKRLSRSPKPGMPIKIRQASMGGYFANIGGQAAIRVRREN
ncbi:hypothetical protein SAMN06295912_12420 [Sphingomonas laterariae]|uniref:Type IV pilus biogenesis protein PilP n=1 Tax=Edaphosphingomonas laterariae TaxID=861865 RepID=A0A239IET4_9SPHN|nr:hypothetical protein [Sphingomonas laterariae]SNS92276.1 hypothetical protein SAMN06295912_12420 [Sphingomonas laterariae]